MIPTPVCPSGNKAVDICIQQSCIHFPFVCGDSEDQQCRRIHSHKKKQWVKWEKLSKQIQNLQFNGMEYNCLMGNIRYRMNEVIKEIQLEIENGMNGLQQQYMKNERGEIKNTINNLKDKKYNDIKCRELKEIMSINTKKQVSQQNQTIQSYIKIKLKNILENVFHKINHQIQQNFYKYKPKISIPILIQTSLHHSNLQNPQYIIKLNLINQNIQSNPHQFHHLFNRATFYQQHHNYKQALSDYNLLLQISPNSWQTYYNRGVVNFQLEKYQQAQQDFNKSIQINNKNDNSYYNRGLIKYKIGKIKEAIDDYEKALQLNGGNVDILYNSGLLYEQIKDYRSAQKCYSKILQKDKNNGEARFRRAISLQKIKRFEECLAEYNRIIEEKGQEFDMCYNNKGIVNKILNNYKQCEQDFNKAIRINDKNGKYYNNRAALYNHLDMLQQSENDFKKAIMLDNNKLIYYQRKAIIQNKINSKIKTKMKKQSKKHNQ